MASCTPFARLHLHCLQVCLETVLTKSAVHECHSNCSHQSNIISAMVEGSPPGTRGCSLPFLLPGQDDHYRGLPVRLGSSYRQLHSAGHLDISRVHDAHQYFGIAGSPKGLQGFSPIHSRSPHFITSDNIMIVFYINKQRGARPIPLCAKVVSALVHQQSDHPVASLSFREPGRASGFP